ncbi:MAG: hypothetical protein G01um101416_1151, partial [Microgenomates group bacterium Gr01-1014_16]
IVIEDTPTPESLIHTIAAKILDLKVLELSIQSELENRLKIHDLHLTLASLENAIKSLSNLKLVIILYETEKILTDNPTSISAILRLWNIQRNQPNAKVSLCFIGSPKLQEISQSLIWSPLRAALCESIIDFPLFDHQEMAYLRNRLQSLTGVKKSSAIINRRQNN